MRAAGATCSWLSTGPRVGCLCSSSPTRPLLAHRPSSRRYAGSTAAKTWGRPAALFGPVQPPVTAVSAQERDADPSHGDWYLIHPHLFHKRPYDRPACDTPAHTIDTNIEAAYRRGDVFEERSVILQGWVDYALGDVPAKSNM